MKEFFTFFWSEANKKQKLLILLLLPWVVLGVLVGLVKSPFEAGVVVGAEYLDKVVDKCSTQ